DVRRVAGERRREPSEKAPVPPGVAAGEDLCDLGLVRVEAGELEVVDVAAVAALAVHELVVEHAEPEVDVRHPWPPLERIIKGIAETAITRMSTKYAMPTMFEKRPLR